MKKTILWGAVAALALGLAACSSGSGTDEGGGTTVTTRAISGTIGGAGGGSGAAALSLNVPFAKAETAGACTAITPAICKVIATAADATTVVDENLGDCAFSLTLDVAKDWAISFVGTAADSTCTQFVATLLAGSNMVFDLASGDAIDLGTITIDLATGIASATNDDVLAATGQTCEALQLADADSDGLCDPFDDQIDDENPVEGEGGGETGPTIEDLAGTYVVSTIQGGAGCEGDKAAYAYSETVGISDGKVDLTDAAQGEYLFNNDEAVRAPTSDMEFTAVTNGFEKANVLLDNGCPMYKFYNKLTFDMSTTPFTLIRELTAVFDAGSNGSLVGCKVIYTKQ